MGSKPIYTCQFQNLNSVFYYVSYYRTTTIIALLNFLALLNRLYKSRKNSRTWKFNGPETKINDLVNYSIKRPGENRILTLSNIQK